MHAIAKLASALLLALLVAAPAAQAGPWNWRGDDIEFHLKGGSIARVSAAAVHTCQAIGTGDFYNELQRFTPPGRFKVRNGRFSGARYVSRAGEYFDIRFTWVGRFRGGRMVARAQTFYKYYRYYAGRGTVLVSCLGERQFSARRG
jgi:hypothetical protein